jgi:dTDP-4-amino-4,6-dideoxygalactose transaminase
MKEIPLSVPNLDIGIADHLRECVETGWVSTGGRFISEFEEKVAAFTGVPQAVGCQSGTAGLHTALRILGVGAGDLVIAPTLTFIAAVNPLRYLGAEPVFMDCDKDLCMDPAKLARYCAECCRFEGGVLTDKAHGRPVKAIIPVHIFGNLADMDAIMDVAGQYGLKVLEDATEALGSFFTEGRFSGRHAGTVGDMGVFSFNANKIITTGGGGMIVSPDMALLEHAAYLTTTAKDDGLYFVHDDVGYNYRMLNLQAALGVSQIGQLKDFIEIKKRNYARYAKNLQGLSGMRLLPVKGATRSNHWFYSLYVSDQADKSGSLTYSNEQADKMRDLVHSGDQVDARRSLAYAGDQAGMTRPSDETASQRDRLLQALIEHGIQCRPLWKLIHTQKPYLDCRAWEIEQAYDYEAHILNLPCSTSLSLDEVDYVCEKIIKMIERRSL